MIWNPDAESQLPAARADLQSERLRATVAWAVERVPFHRERLGGVRVRGLEDLATLPFTRKSDLREHYPFGLFAVQGGANTLWANAATPPQTLPFINVPLTPDGGKIRLATFTVTPEPALCLLVAAVVFQLISLGGQATPPAHMPSIVAQQGFRPAMCWFE